MGNALLLSPAYGWFIGLLVVMIVVTALFALILYIALRPVKKDGFGGGDASYAKELLGRHEAELTSQLLKNQNNMTVKEHLMAKLRDVVAAEKLIAELVEEDGGTQEKAPAKQPKPQKVPAQKPAQPANKPAKPAAAPAEAPAQSPAPAEPAKPVQAAPAEKPDKAAPEAQPAKPAEAKSEADAPKENKE